MKQPEKELINEIKNLFEDYEEDYVPGEWESFSAGRKKDYPFISVWVKVAAVLFLIISVLPYHLSDLYQNKKAIELGKIKAPSDPVRVKLPLNDHTYISNDSRVVANRASKSAGNIHHNKVNPKHPEFHVADHVIAQVTDRAEDQVTDQLTIEKPLLNSKTVAADQSSLSAKLLAEKTILSKDTVAISKNDKRNTMDFLIAESRAPAKKKIKTVQPSKWGFGVEVAPTMTRSNMNIGAGLTTAYRLSDQFSLSSGVSLLQLESGMDIPVSPQAKMSISSLSSRELLAVDANIKAIDIPLALVYHVNKHFYTSVGVSYFNVISEKRNNTYEQTSQLSQTTTNPETGYSSFDRVVVSQSISEPAAETRLKGNSYLGFFNFSVGRRQTLFNKYNVLIEPFIKVPMGKLSAEDLKLTNSGLKFQFSF